MLRSRFCFRRRETDRRRPRVVVVWSDCSSSGDVITLFSWRPAASLALQMSMAFFSSGHAPAAASIGWRRREFLLRCGRESSIPRINPRRLRTDIIEPGVGRCRGFTGVLHSPVKRVALVRLRCRTTQKLGIFIDKSLSSTTIYAIPITWLRVPQQELT